MSIKFKGKTSQKFPIPEKMKAWVLGNPGELSLVDKIVEMPDKSEVLIKIDAVAICATDLDVISRGPPALIEGGLPFNKNFTPGHEYMGTVVALGPSVDEFKIGDRRVDPIKVKLPSAEPIPENLRSSFDILLKSNIKSMEEFKKLFPSNDMH